MRTPSVAVLLTLAAAPLASANLLTDPGFESDPLGDYYDVLGDFAGFEGSWGAEAGFITAVNDGVTPVEGIKMLGMVDDGLTSTQTVQMTDVTAFADLISSGHGFVNLDAMFNVGSDVPAAGCSVFVAFFSGDEYGSMIGGYHGQGLYLDADPLTWEQVALNFHIPKATAWILSQVAYGDKSLQGHAGYADDVHMEVVDVPAPGGAGLVALFGAAGLRRRR